MQNFIYKASTSMLVLVFGLASLLLFPQAMAAKDGGDGSSDSSSSSSNSGSSDQQQSSEKSGSSDSQGSGDSKQGDNGQATDVQKSEQEVEDQQNQEDGVHLELTDDQKTIDSVEIPDLHSTDVHTFDDATGKVDGLEHALGNIQTNLNLSQTTTPLDAAQSALLRTLARKHGGDNDAVKARAKEIQSELSDLHDLLQPLEGQSIPSDSDLRAQVISTIQDLHDQVKDLSNLAKLDVQLVDTETK